MAYDALEFSLAAFQDLVLEAFNVNFRNNRCCLAELQLLRKRLSVNTSTS